MSNNPYGINDQIYDVEIYHEYVDRPREELENIIDQINVEETKYLDKEELKDHLSNEMSRIHTEISELKAKQKNKEKPDRAEKIDKLSEERSNKKQQREIIRKELEGAQNERFQMTLIKHIIE